MKIMRMGANKPKRIESFGTSNGGEKLFRSQSMHAPAGDAAFDLCLYNVKDRDKGSFDWEITLNENDVAELVVMLFKHPHKLRKILEREGVLETVLAGIGLQHGNQLDKSSNC